MERPSPWVQDLDIHDAGSLHGAIAADMLVDIGCEFVILGHSERRSLYAESDADVGVKASVAAAKGLTPIICVGETREERESNVTADVVCRQLDAVIDGAGIDIFPKALVAYEPVWAIGTGLTATDEQAQEVHSLIIENADASGQAAEGNFGYYNGAASNQTMRPGCFRNLILMEA